MVNQEAVEPRIGMPVKVELRWVEKEKQFCEWHPGLIARVHTSKKVDVIFFRQDYSPRTHGQFGNAKTKYVYEVEQHAPTASQVSWSWP